MDVDFYSKIDEELAKIPYCSSKCNYYMVCPVCDRSNTNTAICSLRVLPEAKRRRFVNFYLRGREGLKAEVTELLFNLSNSLDLRNNAQDMITYIDTILKIDRSFKVDQKKVIEIPKIEQEEIPEEIVMVETKKAKPVNVVERAVRKVEKELDNNPDSLFNSPIIDELTAKMKIGQFKLPNEKKVITIQADSYVNRQQEAVMCEE